jgi:hypothetical protein
VGRTISGAWKKRLQTSFDEVKLQRAKRKVLRARKQRLVSETWISPEGAWKKAGFYI